MITESAGIPLGLAIAGANVVDFKLARDTIVSIPISVLARHALAHKACA